MTASLSEDAERLLTFEVESTAYALPIAEIREVAEATRICCVPTISPALVGVMNWHGGALPVVSTTLLLESREDIGEFEADAEEDSGASRDDKPSKDASGLAGAHVLVVSSRDDESGQLGFPIDRVIGLVDGSRCRRGLGKLVVERRPVEGRVVNVLDPRRLIERAIEVIEHAT